MGSMTCCAVDSKNLQLTPKGTRARCCRVGGSRRCVGDGRCRHVFGHWRWRNVLVHWRSEGNGRCHRHVFGHWRCVTAGAGGPYAVTGAATAWETSFCGVGCTTSRCPQSAPRRQALEVWSAPLPRFPRGAGAERRSWACRRRKRKACKEERRAPPCTCHCIRKRGTLADPCSTSLEPRASGPCCRVGRTRPSTRVPRGNNAVGGRGSSFSIGMVTQDPCDARRVPGTCVVCCVGCACCVCGVCDVCVVCGVCVLSVLCGSCVGLVCVLCGCCVRIVCEAVFR